MKSPSRWWRALVGCALLSLTLSTASADEPDRTPAILAAVPDSEVSPTQLTISGKNLGSAKPLVTLDGGPLQVASFSPSVTRVLLPAGLQSGSYLLTLEPDEHADKVARFDLALGALGPKPSVST
jgi:hypothetical protein